MGTFCYSFRLGLTIVCAEHRFTVIAGNIWLAACAPSVSQDDGCSHRRPRPLYETLECADVANVAQAVGLIP